MQNSIIVRISLIGGGQTKDLNPYWARFLRVGINWFSPINLIKLKIGGWSKYSVCNPGDIFRRRFSLSPFCAANFSIIKGGIL